MGKASTESEGSKSERKVLQVPEFGNDCEEERESKCTVLQLEDRSRSIRDKARSVKGIDGIDARKECDVFV